MFLAKSVPSRCICLRYLVAQHVLLSLAWETLTGASSLPPSQSAPTSSRIFPSFHLVKESPSLRQLAIFHICSLLFTAWSYEVSRATSVYIFLKSLLQPTNLASLMKGCIMFSWAALVAQTVKDLPAMWETGVQYLGEEESLEEEMATHSCILARRIPWTVEPGGPQSMGSQSVRRDWAMNTFTFSMSPGLEQDSTPPGPPCLPRRLCFPCRGGVGWGVIATCWRASWGESTGLWNQSSPGLNHSCYSQGVEPQTVKLLHLIVIKLKCDKE